MRFVSMLIIFTVFSCAYSWFSDDKKEDIEQNGLINTVLKKAELHTQLYESTTEQFMIILNKICGLLIGILVSINVLVGLIIIEITVRKYKSAVTKKAQRLNQGTG